MEPNTSLTELKGIGDATASLFRRLKITTIEELIEHVPFRFDDYSFVSTVADIRPGPVTLKVHFSQVKARYVRRGLHLTEALATDETGSVSVVWFNQPYRAASLKIGEEYFISGEFAQHYRFFAISNPACELASSFPLHTARLVPVYRLTKGLGAALVRKTVKKALDIVSVPETLPAWLVESENLISKKAALIQMHFPTTQVDLEKARMRLGFEEVFELLLASELNRRSHASLRGIIIPFAEEATKSVVSALPFTLTDDQRRVSWQILQDMQSGIPMNRLVQGDVGSGKTVVATLAAVNAIQAGYQVAFMAPTELLATQHASSIRKLLTVLGLEDKLSVLTGSMKTAEKKSVCEALAVGTVGLIVGTHALFQEAVSFHSLGLVIVDEQHRFGVEQRKNLQAKAKTMPHVLHLSATPIPRSLALTLYGDMSISVIAHLPSGRMPVQTEITIAENREKIYKHVIEQVAAGRQAFVVCPQIEEDEAGRLSVKKIHTQLQKTWLKELRLGLLHGKLPAVEKDALMQSFVAGEIDVLVSTTVIEVGVDVPNATVMVIEGADKFGLAQLHQLRGRVGRGAHRAHCYLALSDNSEPSKRLRYIEHEYSGFKLADYDLELRGPGAIYGTMQHGALDLRVARLSDTELITRARNAALSFVQRGEKLVHYPHLNKRITRLRTVTNLN